MVNENKTRVRKRKVKKRRKRFLFILIPILVLVGATTAYGAYLYNKADEVVSDSYEDDGRDKSDLRDKEVDPDIDNVSVLFIGVDESNKRDNEGSSRSDALMLATLNKDDKNVKLLSIPRDSYVYIPEVGYNTKINHAHAYGGPKASIEAVESLLDIPVDYYVKMDFEAFIDVVNALNGINVDVPYEMTEQDSNDTANAIHLYPGEQNLNGEEALALARTRKQDNDIERGKRQQEIIKAVIKKAANIGSITKYDDMMEAVGDNMTTNMRFSEMKSFISYGTSGSLDVETLNLEGSDSMIDGIYYYQLDETDLANKRIELRNHLDLESTEHPGDDVNENSSYQNGTDSYTDYSDSDANESSEYGTEPSDDSSSGY
ncbi:LCP family protein [Sediminibacillus halophilus]|uniref:Cell envelope-related function transcriptional attenuator common domain-containing protein n=1 Tax=Sediminibacillus halophilus TaxID=482461 RepID=A0A1G9U5K8_9BACI|nr:LCP family protein [Sediminibacillus halophilus]SDM55267.1 cell envelope-related function transcriptional attenuator common domain-containing protein [Sediminibacillus halophilus]